MNSPIAELQRIVSRRMSEQGAGHGMDHVLRVLRNARLIQKEMGGDPLIVEMAALLHDVGDAKFHAGVERSGEFSRQILADLKVASDTIEKVAAIVDQISFRHGIDAERLSLEGKIVQDADRLDALGAIGIVRTIEYGAAVGQPFFLPDVNLPESQTGVGHFYQKLFKLRELLNTETAQKIAVEREQFMHQFLRQYLKENDLANNHRQLACEDRKPTDQLQFARDLLAITSVEQLHIARKFFQWRGFSLLMGFVLATLAGNLIIPRMLDSTDWEMGWLQIAFMASGMLVAQFTALAMWCVFGLEKVALRLPMTLGLSLVACCAYILGLNSIDDLEQELAIYIFICGIGGYFLACVPMLIARYGGGFRFRLTALVTGSDPTSLHTDTQVSLRYLMGLTTGFAVLLTLLRAIFPESSRGGPPSALVLMMLILQNAVFTLIWLWACVALFVGSMSRTYRLFVLFGLCALVTPLHLSFMEWFYPMFEIGWNEIFNAYAYAIGFCGYTWLALTLAWVFGIELQRSPAVRNEEQAA